MGAIYQRKVIFMSIEFYQEEILNLNIPSPLYISNRIPYSMKRNTFENVLNTPSGKERVVPDINLGNIENMNSSNTQSNSLTNQKLIN